MTSGERLLLLLARGNLTTELQGRALTLIDRGVLSSRILEQSEAHGVTPLVARNFERLGGPDIPEEVRVAFERARRINAARNLLIARELGRVLACLGQAGVPVIPLKGVALAESLYGDAALRVCSDIDILVPRQAVAQAFGLLVGLGYSRAEQEEEVEPGDIDLLLESNIEYAFLPPEPPRCPVELHWDIAWRWPRDADATADLWAETHRRAFGGIEAHALSPEWELLYLAVHAARHRWQALKWIVDVHEICVRGALDWEKVRKKAARFGLIDVLDITLSACRDLLDTPVPGGIRVSALPPWLSLFPSTPGSLGIWREALCTARLFARPTEKLRYLARLLLVPTLSERRLIRLPPALGLLYYPLRPLRLGGKWGLGVVRARLKELREGAARASRS